MGSTLKEHMSAQDLGHASLYLNRELSWLAFNARVLAEAVSPTVPLLERLKFHAIVASNLDEFFMVRVAGLQQQISSGIDEPGADGLSPREQLARINAYVRSLLERQVSAFQTELVPALAAEGIVLARSASLPEAVGTELDVRFRAEIFPILTPIAIDPGHPFPHVRNKSLNIGVGFERSHERDPALGVVQVPMTLPRLMRVTGAKKPDGSPAEYAYVLLEDVIARNLATIFPGVRHTEHYVFRVTRNFDLDIDEDEGEDLLQTIQAELRRRERGAAVRLEIMGGASKASVAELVSELRLDGERDVYLSAAPLNLQDFMQIAGSIDRRELRDEPMVPHIHPRLREAEDPFAVIRDGDVLLHHPFDSFDTVVELIQRAADDPHVLAIKQTLYRAGQDSPIVKALARAAETGKQVTALVELKARFDEASNIKWARTLEQNGVHVVYGVMGLKTHAKCLLIARREGDTVRRYVHVATGNYNPSTARLYTDIGFLTARPEIAEDATALFNLLTGYATPEKWHSFMVAPLDLHEGIIHLIDRESEAARAGKPSGIFAKMNSLVDADVIEALYRASQAGVPIRLNVRGICCLRPGVPGVSDNIRVRAIIDRFLEHSRIFQFCADGKDEIYISSADWMPRNFERRVEIAVPIVDPTARQELVEIMRISDEDTEKAWELGSDGSYARVKVAADTSTIRSQHVFAEIAKRRQRGDESRAAVSGRLRGGVFRRPDDKNS